MLNEEVQALFERVDEAYSATEGATIEERLQCICREAEEKYGKTSTVYAAMRSELGAFYRGQGRFEASVAAFRETLDILEKTVGTESADYITALNNLAGTYRLMHDFDAAEQLFLICLSGYEKTIGTGHVLYASALNNYALVCLDRGEAKKAGQLLLQSSEILAALPECRDEYATSLCNSAALFFGMQEYGTAEKMLHEAIGLYENELGTDTPHYHAAWNTLGAVYYRGGDYKKAESCFARGYEAACALYGPDHYETQALERSLQLMQKLQKEEK